jgi:hypothetical protein
MWAIPNRSPLWFQNKEYMGVVKRTCQIAQDVSARISGLQFETARHLQSRKNLATSFERCLHSLAAIARVEGGRYMRFDALWCAP